MITETWLKQGSNTERMTTDLEDGFGLKILHKDRHTRADGRHAGGGVAILFDPQKVNLRQYTLKKSNHEIIVATGRLTSVKRKIVLIYAYIPPGATVRTGKAFLRTITDVIDNVKKKLKNPFVLVGGDFNRIKIHQALEQYHDIEILHTPPRCGNATLDVLVTNITECQARVLPPLHTPNTQKKSDHLVVVMEADFGNEPPQ